MDPEEVNWDPNNLDPDVFSISAKLEWKCVPYELNVDFNKETVVEYNWAKHAK